MSSPRNPARKSCTPRITAPVGLLPELPGDDPHRRAAAQKEHHRPEPPEEVHRRSPEMGHEQHRDEVEVSLDRALESELRMPVLAGVVVDDLLADAAESGLLGKNRNETVHLPVDLDRLHDLAPIGLQPAVEVVEPDARDAAGRPVEELARPPLADRVAAFLFPPRDQVVALLEDHAPQGGDLVGRILQVGVHREDHLAFGCGKPAVEGRRLAVVAREADGPDGGVLRLQALDGRPRVVRRAVVDHHDLIGQPFAAGHAVDPRRQFGERLGLVVERHDDRYVQFRALHHSGLLFAKGRASRRAKAAMKSPKKAPLTAEPNIVPRISHSGEWSQRVICSSMSAV